MKTIRNLFLASVALLVLAAPAARAAANDLAVQAGAKLWLEGTSTIHEYRSEASKLQIVLHEDPARWPADKTGADAIEAMILANGITGMDVVVGVTGLHSGKDGLDRNMYKALKAAQNPEIQFHLGDYAARVADDHTTIEAKGTLTIAGVQHDVPVTVTASRDGENVRLQGSVPLLMTAYGIQPPKMMLGALKVADAVTVSFDFTIGAGGGGPMSISR